MEQRYSYDRPIGGDHFRIKKIVTKQMKTYLLDELINGLNLDNYHIYKMTNKFKRVTSEEFLIFEYGGYIFFNKVIYNLKDIERWIKWLYDNKLDYHFLNKPFPPVEVLNKIQIKK